MSEWLSITEFARRNSCSEMTVRRRIKNGRLHAVLRDGKYQIQSNSPGEAPPPQDVHVEPKGVQTSEPTQVPSQKVNVPENSGWQKEIVDEVTATRSCVEVAVAELRHSLVNDVKSMTKEITRLEGENRNLRQELDDLRWLVEVMDQRPGNQRREESP